MIDATRAKLLKEIAQDLPDVVLNDRQLCDFELLATGTYSPLEGYMKRTDYESVVDRMRLQNGLLWPLPVCLDVHASQAGNLEGGQSLAIRDPEGFMLGVLHVEDVWQVDHEKQVIKLYGENVANDLIKSGYLKGLNDHYVGGKLEVISLPLHFEFKQLRMTPQEIRTFYRKLGWQRVIGFLCKQLVHRPQFEMTIQAMRAVKGNLLMLPLSGVSKPGDIDFYTRIKCYRALSRYYPPDSSIINLLPYDHLGEGIREKLLKSIIAKNYGCTHCITDCGNRAGGKPFTDEPGEDLDRAGEQHDALFEEVGIDLIPFEEMVYLPFDDAFCGLDQVADGVRTVDVSNEQIQKRIRSGRRVPEWASFSEVVAELQKTYLPPQKQGFTVFLTGLSGAGKSTVAKILYSRFLEIGGRPVTLLDGDIVRRNLSSELSFSKEHRDINVRRIGFVASEITKNRGIAICAPIAPYRETRREIRSEIEAWGGFIEVHISTPIEVCEKRDRKGMYAKARAGLIKGFTGVDDPYEMPEFPEVSIDTTGLTPDEAAQEILLFLGQKGYLT